MLLISWQGPEGWLQVAGEKRDHELPRAGHQVKFLLLKYTFTPNIIFDTYLKNIWNTIKMLGTRVSEDMAREAAEEEERRKEVRNEDN